MKEILTFVVLLILGALRYFKLAKEELKSEKKNAKKEDTSV